MGSVWVAVVAPYCDTVSKLSRQQLLLDRDAPPSQPVGVVGSPGSAAVARLHPWVPLWSVLQAP